MNDPAGDAGMLVIRRRRQVRALESPVRQEIVDAVAAGGACTMAELAGWLGRRADALYYHVAALVKVGLLVEVGKRRAGKRFGAVYDVPARPVYIAMGGEVGGEDVARVIRSALRLADRDLRRALASGTVVSEGPDRNLWAGRVKGWVAKEDLGRVGELVAELNGLLRRPPAGEAARGGATGYSFTCLAAPLVTGGRARAVKDASRRSKTKGAKR